MSLAKKILPQSNGNKTRWGSNTRNKQTRWGSDGAGNNADTQEESWDFQVIIGTKYEASCYGVPLQEGSHPDPWELD